jgi:hypothetical protein
MPLDTTATRRALLAPDWGRPATWLPALAHHVATTTPADDVCLCVDAAATDLPAALVYELLAVACEAVSGGREFGDVLVLTEPLTGAERAGMADPAPPGGPAYGAADAPRAVAHARAVKGLADTLRDRVDRHRFEAAADPWTGPRPLVSVRIPTWNGREALVDRTLPSVLHGSYAEVEVIVCSDGPDAACRAAVAGAGDPRVRYVEVPERPVYPGQRMSFWRVAGNGATNHALDHCAGAFIAPLDHDDSFTLHHVAELLSAAARERADFVYGQALCELGDGPWVLNGSAPLAFGNLSHGAVLYSSRLAHLRYDDEAWLIGEPADWNMWRRIAATGAKIAFHPAPVLVHYAERGSIGGEMPAEPTDAELLADLLATPARWLLGVPLA